MLVSGVQQSDSVIHIFIRFQLFIHIGYYRILSEFPVLYSRSLLVIFFIYSNICMLIPNSYFILPLTPFPFGNHVCFLYLWVCFVNKVIYILLKLDFTCKWYHIFVFLCLTSLSVIISKSIHVAADSIISFFFYGWVISFFLWLSYTFCIYVPYLYPFIHHWSYGLLPCLSYCKYSCYEHWSECVFSNESFSLFQIYAQNQIVALFLV